MDLARKIGIGIVMIVPAFVFGGVLWALVESWLAVLGLEILMVLIYAWTVSEGRSVRALKA